MRPAAYNALGVPKSIPPKPKARKPGAPDEPDVFSKLASAVDKAKQAASGDRANDAPAVAADQFDKKKDDNSFLASRPIQAVNTHTARRKRKGGKKKRT